MNRAFEPTQPIEIFFCYAHEDKPLRDELDKHLAALKRSGIVYSWHDGEIVPGDSWEEVVKDHLNKAQVILLLISASFMNSNFCYSIEMARALERHHGKSARVIPIRLRPVDLKYTPINKLQMLPKGAKPITIWKNNDAAFEDVARGIRRAIEEIVSPPRSSTPSNPSPALPIQRQSPLLRWLTKRNGVYQITIGILVFLLLVLKVVPVAISSGTKTIVASFGSSSLPFVPTPIPTVPPKGTVLYNADWSKGNDGWNITGEWNINDGVLVNNKSTIDTSKLLAPLQLTTTNYAVDARIQTSETNYAFGIIVGSDGNSNGYACYMYHLYDGSVNITNDLSVNPRMTSPLQSHLYQVDTNWHTYRVEVRGIQITLLIDNQQFLQVLSSNHSSAREVGLIDENSAINVGGFKVTSL
jgi:hypothetical protein